MTQAETGQPPKANRAGGNRRGDEAKANRNEYLMKTTVTSKRQRDAIRILLLAPALDALIDRGWLEVTTDADTTTVECDHYDSLSTGEKKLVTLIGSIGGTVGVYLDTLAEHVDDANARWVASAMATLFRSSEQIVMVPLLDGETLVGGAL